MEGEEVRVVPDCGKEFDCDMGLPVSRKMPCPGTHVVVVSVAGWGNDGGEWQYAGMGDAIGASPRVGPEMDCLAEQVSWCDVVRGMTR
nr:hypothetical protein BOH68_03835 [Cobetia sp. MM1IDA2H-1]